MKISPVAQGTGVPAQSEGSIGRTASPEKLERAKAIARGDQVQESSGDQQVDRTRASIKRIKMRTQVSTNRDDNQELEEPIVEQILKEEPEQIATPDVSESAQSTEETKPLSPQFAALAKAKRALQVKERELAQREEALKTQAPAGQEDVIAKLKANPLSVLQEAGVTYDQLTQAILNDQSNSTVDVAAIKAQIREDLKKELLGEFSTRDNQQEQQVLNDLKKEALAITNQGEQFEAIREAKAQKDVVDLIHRTWKTTGEVLDVQEAAELVENQLIEEALPFAKLKKIQSRLTPQEEQQAAQTPAAPKPNTKIMRTLTNRDNASPVMDKRARAIAAMNGTLRKG